LGANAPYLLLGAFINAEAVGQTLTHLLSTTVLAVTVLACGERWQSPFEEGTLRFAVEDFLGAGAVFAAIAPEMTRSPEAKAAEVAFLALRASLSETLLACGSGVELVERGFANDVLHAAQENRYPISPILHDGEYFIPFSEKPVSAL
jgi:2-phosphosulfolactate phosphatase